MVKKDRDHYASLSDKELLEVVPYGIDVEWEELSHALSDRLKNGLRDYDYDSYTCARCGYEG